MTICVTVPSLVVFGQNNLTITIFLLFKLLRGRFEVFAPQERYIAPMGVKFGTEEGFCPLLYVEFHPHRCNDKGIGPPKLKFLLKFDQNVEYKRPTGAYHLRDFHKICRVCIPFQDIRLLLKFRWICSRGYGVMRVLS